MTPDAWADFWRAVGSIGLVTAGGLLTLIAAWLTNRSSERRENARVDREDQREREKRTEERNEGARAELRVLCLEFIHHAYRHSVSLTQLDSQPLLAAFSNLSISAPETLVHAAGKWTSSLVAKLPSAVRSEEEAQHINELAVAFYAEARRWLALTDAEIASSVPARMED